MTELFNATILGARIISVMVNVAGLKERSDKVMQWLESDERCSIMARLIETGNGLDFEELE